MLRKLFFNYMYFKHPPWDTGVVPPELIRFTSTHPSGRALDLGCGTGTNAIYLAKNGWQVVAVDFSRRAISIAKRKALAEKVNVIWKIDDVSRLKDISGNFDFILDIGCFHGLNPTQKERYLHNINNLLSEKGIFLLYGFLTDQPQSVGITSSDIDQIRQNFLIIDQELGVDQTRTSTWLTIMKNQPNMLDPQ